jgi:hypothetical protein
MLWNLIHKSAIGVASLCSVLYVAAIAAAQSGPDLSSAPLDIFYSHSSSLMSTDENWVPLSEYKTACCNQYVIGKLKIPIASDRNRPDATDAKIEPVVRLESKTRVHWRPAIMESLYFTGIMHAFRFPTEAGTRDTLNGHWFRDYIDSLSELRGWSDGDTFMAPYVGHPIEGSIFSFILRQNDPRYRDVQWGDGRDYFISVLRSMAWSAIWHTQWKIGPASEASLGNVMLHASPGFITLVDTPTLGTATMIVEDITGDHWSREPHNEPNSYHPDKELPQSWQILCESHGFPRALGSRNPPRSV